VCIDIGIKALRRFKANGIQVIGAGPVENKLHALAIVFFVHARLRIRRFARRGLLDLGRSRFSAIAFGASSELLGCRSRSTRRRIRGRDFALAVASYRRSECSTEAAARNPPKDLAGRYRNQQNNLDGNSEHNIGYCRNGISVERNLDATRQPILHERLKNRPKTCVFNWQPPFSLEILRLSSVFAKKHLPSEYGQIPRFVRR
jgi:hypothetical protein